MRNAMHRYAISTFIALMSLIAVTSPAAAADGEEAKSMQTKYIHLMHKKNYGEALALILARRQARDGWAIGYFGDWFQADAPKEMKDVVEEWLDKASRAGNAEAQYTMGMKYLKGDYLSGDYAKPGKREDHIAEGARLLEKAADQGLSEARFALSQMSRKALNSVGVRSKYAGQE
jgi:TPR repeat protein